MSQRSWRRAPLSSVVVLAALAASCSDSDNRVLDIPLDSDQAYQDLFWDYCLPLAEVLTVLGGQADGNAPRSAAPTPCSQGGTAAYNSATGIATLTACSAAGITIDGTLALTISAVGPNYSVVFSSGALTVTGAYAGTVVLHGGMMQWAAPVTDAGLYWKLNVALHGGADVCIWSGASQGPCPAF